MTARSPEPAGNPAEPEAGFAFGVSGGAYLPLAIRAAQSLRRHHPDHPIDLFTDQPCNDPVFSRVVPLLATGFRPKFEALRQSRFGKTIVLDADIICLAPIADVFDLLDRFDIAAVHEHLRNTDWALRLYRKPIPAAFPQINSGLIAIRKSPRVLALIGQAERELRESGMDRDQPILREMLYESDLRLAILPPEYNFMQIGLVEAYSRRNTAPRLLHLPRLHKHLRTSRRRRELRSVGEICGPAVARQIEALIAADRTLGGSRRRVRPMLHRGLPGLARLLCRDLPMRLIRLFSRY